MELVGQPVPDRDAGIGRQDLDDVLVEAAVLDAVVEPAEHPSRVLDALLVPHLRRHRVEIGHMGALVVRRDLERAPRPRGRLLEDQADLLLAQAFGLGAGLLRRLEIGGEIEQVADLVGRVIELLEEVATLQAGGRGEGGHVVLRDRSSCGFADRWSGGQTGSRSSGQVMQWPPPRPLPTSEPSRVMTSTPAFRNSVLVNSLRS